MRHTKIFLLVALFALIVVPAAWALRFTDESYTPAVAETGKSYNWSFTGAGGCGPALPYQYRVLNGSPPPGLSLDTSGLVHGIPTQAGDYSFWVELSDENPPEADWCRPSTAQREFTFHVVQGLSINQRQSTLGLVALNAPWSLQLSATGPGTWTVDSGALPAGVGLNSSTGLLSGTPTALGDFTFKIKITNGARSDTQTYTLSVVADPAKNAQPPTISGTPAENNSLTANKGSWTGAPSIGYTYQWRRCDTSGGSCSSISGASASTYLLKSVDVGATIRVQVTGKNGQGSATATSAPTAVITKASQPSGAVVSISEVSLPNRLIIDQYSFQPNRLRKHGRLFVRIHVSDSHNHSVQGALVFIEGVPLGQVLPSHVEQPTGPDGYATFNLHASSRLQFRGSNRFAFFLRARKAGENPLGGVAARRLVAVYLG